jgi:hypothetical protein
MPFDYTTVPLQDEYSLIPKNTVALVIMTIRDGSIGEDNLLKPSGDRMSAMLSCEFKVIGGEHDGRKFWDNLILEGTAKHESSIEINRKKLRAIIESSLGIHPKDESKEAREKHLQSLRFFQNRIFTARIGIEEGGINKKNGTKYRDKNFLVGVVTPDQSDWQRPEEPPPFDGGSPKAGGDGTTPTQSTTTAPAIARPSWAS